MANIKSLFSGYSVTDIQKAQEFYSQTLGVEAVIDEQMGALKVKVADGPEIFIYQKDNHEPATYTVLNFVVDNIGEVVDELAGKGVKFEMYEGFEQDEKGIARSTDPSKGPSIAWFKDPAGNILSVLEA